MREGDPFEEDMEIFEEEILPLTEEKEHSLGELWERIKEHWRTLNG